MLTPGDIASGPKQLHWPVELIRLEELLTTAQQYGPRGDMEKQLLKMAATHHPEEKRIYEALVIGYRNTYQPSPLARTLADWLKEFPRDWLALRWSAELAQSY